MPIALETPSGSPRSSASDSRAALRVAFAGGGTGGHVVPGLHLLAEARAAGPEVLDLVWFTSGRAIEERVFAGAGPALAARPFERVTLAVGARGGAAPSRARLALNMPGAWLRARERLAAHRAQVLLGLGGFASAPAVLAARTLGIPVALLEVNAVRGAATRWLAPLADRTLHAFPPGPEAGPRSVHTGPPLAPELARGTPGEAEHQAARTRLGFDPLRPLLVVLGGSQGAGALNAFVRASLARLAARGVQVLHQTGPGRLSEAAREAPGYRALEYVDPIRPALAAATLVLCRGGASTLCEVAALGVPAFVAPYPLAAGDHQTRNALRLGSGARLVRDAELGEPLADELASLAGAERRAEREARGAALAAALPRDGAARIWDVLADLAGWKAHAREGRIAGGGT